MCLESDQSTRSKKKSPWTDDERAQASSNEELLEFQNRYQAPVICYYPEAGIVQTMFKLLTEHEKGLKQVRKDAAILCVRGKQTVGVKDWKSARGMFTQRKGMSSGNRKVTGRWPGVAGRMTGWGNCPLAELFTVLNEPAKQCKLGNTNKCCKTLLVYHYFLYKRMLENKKIMCGFWEQRHEGVSMRVGEILKTHNLCGREHSMA